MFSNQVDLGQVLILALTGAIAFFIKREIESVNRRLDRHDNMLIEFAQQLGHITGRNFKVFDEHKRGHE